LDASSIAIRIYIVFQQTRKSSAGSESSTTSSPYVLQPSYPFFLTVPQEVMGRYPSGLQEVLTEVPDVDKAALDLGCGCGTWIMDLARDFPHVRAVGIDLIPVQATDMPFNCRSEIDDINLGLEHFYGEFDVVHARLISSGVISISNTSAPIHQCTTSDRSGIFPRW